jgi:hypothetical protein
MKPMKPILIFFLFFSFQLVAQQPFLGERNWKVGGGQCPTIGDLADFPGSKSSAIVNE